MNGDLHSMKEKNKGRTGVRMYRTEDIANRSMNDSFRLAVKLGLGGVVVYSKMQFVCCLFLGNEKYGKCFVIVRLYWMTYFRGFC